jgi:holo-[acyl-carrier protein] synthase
VTALGGKRPAPGFLAELGAQIGVIGIGTDLVDVDRMRKVLVRTPTFADRVFTDGERALARARPDPAKPYAARFAAKEAVLKAFGVGIGDVPVRTIEVVRAESGEPSILLHGAAAALAAERGVTRLLLSMTHTDHLAHALVVALRD